ncbi:MAG: hypothetical protein QXU79_02980 [Candidatus Micrarchaeaceae archaeon]
MRIIRFFIRLSYRLMLLLLLLSLLAGCQRYFASPSPQPQPEATRVMPPTDTPIPYPLPTQEPPPPPSPTPTPGPTPIVLGVEWAPEAERETYVSTTVVVAPVGDGPGEVGYYVFPCPPGGEDCPLPIKAEKFTVDARGNIYILDVVNKRVAKFDPEGRFVTNVPYGDIIQGAEDLAADADGHIYLSAPWEEVPKVVLLDPEGKLLWETPVPSLLDQQHILAMRVDEQGTLWVEGRGFLPDSPVIEGQPYPEVVVPLGNAKETFDEKRQRAAAVSGVLWNTGTYLSYAPTARSPLYLYDRQGRPVYACPQGFAGRIQVDQKGNLYLSFYNDLPGYTIRKYDRQGRQIASFDLPFGIIQIDAKGTVYDLTWEAQTAYYVIRWQVKR